MEQTKKKHKIRVILAVLGFGLLGVIGVVMILLGTVPGIYQPFARPGSGQVSPYLTHDMGPGFFAGMQGDKPFEMVFQQWGLNEMLALTTESMQVGEFTLSSPNVALNPGTLVLMVTVEIKGISSVLSISARPVMDQEGMLNLNIQSATLGAVPVLGLVRTIGRQFADDYLVGTEEQEFAGIIKGILNNEPIEPTIVFSNYSLRVKALTFEEGKVRLLIEPIKDKDVRDVRGSRVP